MKQWITTILFIRSWGFFLFLFHLSFAEPIEPLTADNLFRQFGSGTVA